MEGATSLDEERRLAEYFRSHPNEPGMEDIASLFALFDTGMPIEGITDVEPKAPKAQTPRRIALRPAWWTSVAAVAAVLVAFTFSRRYLPSVRVQETAHAVCHVPQQGIEEQPTAQPIEQPTTQPIEKPAAEPVAKPIIKPTTKTVPHIAQKPLVAQASPKAQPKPKPEPVPEMASDSVAEAILMKQEAAVLQAYARMALDVRKALDARMALDARIEESLRRQAVANEAMAEYVACQDHGESKEQIEVW